MSDSLEQDAILAVLSRRGTIEMEQLEASVGMERQRLMPMLLSLRQQGHPITIDGGMVKMPKGVYNRTKRTENGETPAEVPTPRQRRAVPASSGDVDYAAVVADLKARRAVLDSAIEAIEQLVG